MTKRQARKIKLFQIRYGLDKPCCFACGCTDNQIDFHHLDNTTKKFNPSQAKNFKEFFEETSKCIPLCKECHTELHRANGNTKNRVTVEISMKWIYRQV